MPLHPQVVLTQHPVPPAFSAPLEAEGFHVAGIPGITRHINLSQPPPVYPTTASQIVITSHWGWLGLTTFLQQQEKFIAELPPITVVGQNTADKIQAQGGNIIHVAETVTALAETLRLQKPGLLEHTLLWPCGNRALTQWIQTLPPSLKIHPWVVYQTVFRTNFSPLEVEQLQHAKILALTSPSNLQGLTRANLALPQQCVAIGPTTATAVYEKLGHPAHAIAATPALEALACASLSLLPSPQ